MSENSKQSNVQVWKLTYLDYYRLLCVSFGYSLTLDGITLNARTNRFVQRPLLSPRRSADTFPVCKKLIRNPVEHVHGQEIGILQDKSTWGNQSSNPLLLLRKPGFSFTRHLRNNLTGESQM